MKPRRFFINGEPISPGERLVAGNSAHHLSRVLRLRVGEQVVLFDGSGCEFPAEILEVRRRLVRLGVEPGEWVDRESPLILTLGMGVCHPATMDFVVAKVTELGVSEIVPVATERAQTWLAGERVVSRYRRWQRIAQESARQSGRNRVPQILPMKDFHLLLQEVETGGLKIIFWEEEGCGSLKRALRAKSETHHVSVLIGPEGGFSADEVKHAAAAGFQSISLGRRVLRAETAAIAVISLLQYELGDLGLLP